MNIAPRRQAHLQYPRGAARGRSPRRTGGLRGRQQPRSGFWWSASGAVADLRACRRRRPGVRERHRRGRILPHQRSGDLRRRRLHQSSLAAVRHARAPGIGRQRVRAGERPRRSIFSDARRFTIGCPGSGRISSTTNCSSSGFPRATIRQVTARRSGDAQLQRVLPEGRRVAGRGSRQSFEGLHGGTQAHCRAGPPGPGQARRRGRAQRGRSDAAESSSSSPTAAGAR